MTIRRVVVGELGHREEGACWAEGQPREERTWALGAIRRKVKSAQSRESCGDTRGSRKADVSKWEVSRRRIAESPRNRGSQGQDRVPHPKSRGEPARGL